MKKCFLLLAFTISFCIGLSVFAQTVPFPPVSLTASSVKNQVSLTWLDDSTNETEFRVSRRTAYAGTWNTIATPGINSTSYIDKGLNSGSYEYKVNACNDSGCSGNSIIVYVSIVLDTIAPTTPESFSVSGVSATQANLSWSASSDDIGLSSYNIYRSSSSPSNFTFIASVSDSQLGYSDLSLSPTSVYYYHIKAADISKNESAPSATVEITTLPLSNATNYIRLEYPNGGECFNIGTNIPIKWTGIGVNSTALYYDSRSSNRIFLNNATSFDWFITASVSATSQGTIWAVAVNGHGIEGVSDKNDAPFTISLDCKKETSSAVTIPAIPSNFRASFVNEKAGIMLDWQDNSTNEKEFRIYRRLLPEGKWGVIGTVGANMTQYIDQNVPPGLYEYDSNACNDSGCSTYSNIFQINSQASLPVNPAKTYSIPELQSGDLVSATGSDGGSSDPDIYIINEHNHKRLFLNPAIFNFYGHLGGFERVKRISAPTRDTYKTSGLFRNCEINDTRVYGVEIVGEDAGVLHWVNTTGEQAVTDDPNFFKKVFCINNNEFDWYQKGSDYNSVNQIPPYSR